MHVQSSCFANLTLSLFLPFSLLKFPVNRVQLGISIQSNFCKQPVKTVTICDGRFRKLVVFYAAVFVLFFLLLFLEERCVMTQRTAAKETVKSFNNHDNSE